MIRALCLVTLLSGCAYLPIVRDTELHRARMAHLEQVQVLLAQAKAEGNVDREIELLRIAAELTNPADRLTVRANP